MACFLLLERRGCFERLLSLLRDQLPHSSFPRPYGTCNLEDRVFFTRKHWFMGAITPLRSYSSNNDSRRSRETSTRPRASWLKICPGSSSSANAIESFYDIPTRANRGARRDAYDVPTLQPFERADLDHWPCVTRRTTHRLPSRRAESVASAGADPTVDACAIQFAPRSVCYEALSLTEIDIWPSGLDSPSDPHLIRLNSDKGTKTLIGFLATFYARRTFGNWVLGEWTVHWTVHDS
jgi:hypothetical protein